MQTLCQFVGGGVSDTDLVPSGQKVGWQGPTLKHKCIWYHSHGGDANSVPIGVGEGMLDAHLVPIGNKVSWQGGRVYGRLASLALSGCKLCVNSGGRGGGGGRVFRTPIWFPLGRR